jgi:2-amino-4-hydroxy-6-hydroxymethyldihydropteridine diphosphokinase
MARAYLSLGSNQDRERNLCACLERLEQRFGKLTVSPIYRCAAVGFVGDEFFNLVVGLDTDMGPADLDRALKVLEDELGRRRDRPRFSDRSIDIDLLLHDDRVESGAGVILPRPEICGQAYVLKPLSDLAPDQQHPLTGQSFARMWLEMAARGHDLEPVDIGWKDQPQ